MPLPTRNRQWSKFLRPLYWWLLLVVVLYGVRKHQEWIAKTQVQFSVTLADRPVDSDANMTLDGKPVAAGQRISLGSHTLTITHPKADPFTTKFFAWYGPHDLGRIKLARSMGTLAIKAAPCSPTVTVGGPEFAATLHDCAETNLTVPTDLYSIRAEYPHWSQSQNVAVLSGQSAVASFSPQFGAVRLASNKEDATYRIESAAGEYIGSGDLPATVTSLPVGNYRFIAIYHQRQISKTAAVALNGTNDVAEEFRLGAIRLESTPAGATVSDASGNLGETPLELPDMTPQTRQFNLSLSGYQSVLVDVEIIANQTNTCRTNLVSLRYLSAMREAHERMAAKSYAEAVQASGEALSANPNDAEAITVQTEANALLNAERQRIAAEEERLAQLKRPREVFDALCAQNKDASLFDAHELKVSKPAKDVKAAIFQALRSDPMAFEVYYQDTPKPEVYEMLARQEFSLGVLGGSLRLCLMVVGQTKEGETEVMYKILEYQVQHTVMAEGLKFRDDKHLIPMTAANAQPNDAFQIQIREGTKAMVEKIQATVQ